MATERTGRFRIVASKKKLKRRAKEQERLADDMFLQAQQRGQELAAIDQFLHDLKLPGPTLNEWALQMRDALVKLGQMRGITANPTLGLTGLSNMSPSESSGPSISSQAGEYSFLTESEVSRNLNGPEPSRSYPIRPGSSGHSVSSSPLPRMIRDNPQA